MITMNCMGSIGRLGNQMFQYAALRSLAKKFNYQYCLPIKDFKLEDEDYDLFDCFKLNGEERKNLDLYKIEMKTPGFDEEIFNKCPDNVDLHGYFQDVKYFENNADDIRKSFVFKELILDPAKQYFHSTFPDEDIISLHIRRGDYVPQEHHPTQTIEYYSNALKFFHSNLKVLIFTDDIEWARAQDIFKDERFFFSTNNNNAVDLCLQTLCKYHIIANSSFSWWGAWLANSKQVVRPQSWFAGVLQHHTNFLDVNGWIKL